MLLRMRLKPPAGMPHINSGKPWSAMDLEDLQDLLGQDEPIAEIADYLCREVDEVAAKVAALRRQDTAAPEIIRNAVRRWLKEIGAKAAKLRDRDP
jgi:hypothetical protein